MHYIVDWILPFLVVLTVLIFVHELGHYLIARMCGVMVEIFSIGFGPELFGRTDLAGTRWRVSAIPLGGYVKMHGEDTFEEEGQEKASGDHGDHLSFRNKTLRQRAAIVSAGPLANIVFALGLLLALFSFVGAPAPLPVIGALQENSAAAEAGFVPGDVILEIEGEKIAWFEDVRRIVSAHPGVTLQFRVQRGDTEMQIAATPRVSSLSGDGEARTIGLLGIKPDLTKIGYEELSVPKAAVAAVGQTYSLATQIVGAIINMITGDQALDEVGGPLQNRADFGSSRAGRHHQPSLFHGGPIRKPGIDKSSADSGAGWRPPLAICRRGHQGKATEQTRNRIRIPSGNGFRR